MFDALKSLYSKVSDRSILSLFDDPNRAGEFSVRFDHMLFDYSKTNIDNAARTACWIWLAIAVLRKNATPCFRV